MKVVLEETEPSLALKSKGNSNMTKLEIPMKLWKEMGKSTKIGMVNFDEDDISEWESSFEIIPIAFQKVLLNNLFNNPFTIIFLLTFL